MTFALCTNSLLSVINTGEHQEACQYFINLNLVKREIMKQLK